MPNAIVIDSHPDPHADTRELARSILANEAGFATVRFVKDGVDALRAMREQAADLVIMDLELADLPGDAMLEELSTSWPATRILVMSAQRRAGERALLAGAHGCVERCIGLPGLADAVRAVMRGYATFPVASLPTFRRAANNPADPRNLLSRRELTVLRFLAVGYSNKAISTVLSISNKTVSSHKTSIMSKLGVGSLIDLAEFARRHRLAPQELPSPAVLKAHVSAYQA